MIEIAAGENSSYYEGFREVSQYELLVTGKYTAVQMIAAIEGILIALRDDLEQGLLGETEDLVRAEVFTGFLEMAQHLLETEYKDPAAVLVGTVLENGLKKIAEKKGIQFNDNDGIGALNKGLANAKVYTRLKQQQVQAWAAIRNSAAHGSPKDYSATDVKYMLDGVQNFLDEHFG